MGEGESKSQQELFLDRMAELFVRAHQWHDCRIDRSLESFSGLDSIEDLNKYRDQVLYSGEISQVPSVVEKMGSELGGLNSLPNAIGLGALVISLALNVVAKSLNKETMDTDQMLERVFARETVSEVRDLMQDYLMRMQINLRNPKVQLSETRQTETALSVQLTRLKNSMLRDGHMNSHVLKQWANGAAFHCQMLIHEARLEGASGTRAKQAAGVYQQELNLLMAKYKSLINDGSSEVDIKLTKAIFSNYQISWTNNYFSDLQRNIQTLVSRNAVFHIQI